MQLDKTAAIVTGGASGLGAATARRLAAQGVKVALFDLNETQGEALAKELGGVFCKVDVTKEDTVDAGFAKSRAAMATATADNTRLTAPLAGPVALRPSRRAPGMRCGAPSSSLRNKASRFLRGRSSSPPAIRPCSRRRRSRRCSTPTRPPAPPRPPPPAPATRDRHPSRSGARWTGRGDPDRVRAAAAPVVAPPRPAWAGPPAPPGRAHPRPASGRANGWWHRAAGTRAAWS